MERRDFVRRLSAAFVAATAGSSTGTTGHAQGRASLAIDGLGEVHLDYSPSLIDEMLASGLRACVVTVGNPAIQGPSAFDDMRSELLAYDRHIAANPERFRRATSVADIDRARAGEKLALIYYTQNATPINDDVSRLEELRRLGVRIIQLTYNTRNLLGDGCLERTNSGLSKFGVEVVERMNGMQLLVDASHCGEATTQDAIATSRQPIAITHSACKAVYDHARSKTDATIRQLANKGGVLGVFQINPYLGAKERNTLDDYVRHIEHARNVGGEDHVAIGSDREHRTIPDTDEEKQKLIDELSRLRPVNNATFRWPFFVSELNGPRRMEAIRHALERRRWPGATVDKVMGGNWYRLFQETIG
ncbi:MAG: dipeptidase [Gemmatimonadaceae bacterium]